MTQVHIIFEAPWERAVTHYYHLNCTYRRVLPPSIWLPFIFVAIALWAGVALPGVVVPLWARVAVRVGLPVGVNSPSSGFVIVPPSLASAGGRWNIVPYCCTVLLHCMGRWGVVALVVLLGERHTLVMVGAGIGDWLSSCSSGVSRVIIWVPPEREKCLMEKNEKVVIKCLLRRQYLILV